MREVDIRKKKVHPSRQYFVLFHQTVKGFPLLTYMINKHGLCASQHNNSY